ncbi:MAG TPA: hypothetical protein PK156_29135 [Polyangium sp.]|nr:hypothetical protein [Polyangium sp.]
MPEKRVYADMSPTLGTVTSVPVRGRIVYERDKPDLRSSTPLQQASQEELKGIDFDVVLQDAEGKDITKLGAGKNDQEGYIDAAFPLKEGTVTPGRYRVDIRVKNGSVGQTTVQLLANDYKGAVVRSDIDLTYLDTHFTRKRDMIGLLTQKAAERKTLPGMEKVYAALRAGASGKEDRPLVFVSGSPRFFKRTLEAKMVIDGVVQNGIMLKAFEEIAYTQLINLDPDRIVSALKEQVGYKLGHLLRGRLELPTNASEILLGDDSEADFVVYSIYHRLMSGQLDGAAAPKELVRGGVDPSQTTELITLATKVRATLNGFVPVKAIYINLTGSPNEKLKVKDWPVPGILREHRGAWPLILDLAEEGFVSKESVATVKTRLIDSGLKQSDLDEAAKDAVKSGFLDKKSVSP